MGPLKTGQETLVIRYTIEYRVPFTVILTYVNIVNTTYVRAIPHVKLG